MPLSKNKSLKFIVPIAVLTLILNAVLPFNALRMLNISHEETVRSRETIESATNVLLSMVDAETGMRGYVITSNPRFLEPYYAATARLRDQVNKLQELTADSMGTAKKFKTLEAKTDAALSRIQDTISANHVDGVEAADQMIRSGEGKARMDAVRKAAADLVALERSKLKIAELYENKLFFYTSLGLVFLTAFDVLMFALAFRVLFRSLETAKHVETELNKLHVLTMERGELLTQSNSIKDMQAKFADLLQAVLTPDEAYEAIERFCKTLFPQNAGALFIRSHSKDYLELAAKWGELGYGKHGFEPQDCWAVRSNHVYKYIDGTECLPCHHHRMVTPEPRISICIPISSPDEMIGMLVLYGEITDEGSLPVPAHTEKLATEVVAQVGLAIANLRLKENLRKSSIVDALTGLYNRRYLSETLVREIARSQRSNEQMAVIMLDVDHFKSFNDNFGHEAGDFILQEVGQVLKNSCRTSDIACRYGGEEFVIILLNAGLDTAMQRAEAIRLGVKKKLLTYGGQTLPGITISSGISLYPKHSAQPDQLIKLADDALYQAKRNGRDRIETYSE